MIVGSSSPGYTPLRFLYFVLSRLLPTPRRIRPNAATASNQQRKYIPRATDGNANTRQHQTCTTAHAQQRHTYQHAAKPPATPAVRTDLQLATRCLPSSCAKQPVYRVTSGSRNDDALGYGILMVSFKPFFHVGNSLFSFLYWHHLHNAVLL